LAAAETANPEPDQRHFDKPAVVPGGRELMKTPKEVVEAWVEAYNARDANAVAELYRDEPINHQVAIGEPVVGRPAVRRAALAFFQAFPDISIRTEIVLQDGDWVAFEWSGKARWLGGIRGRGARRTGVHTLRGRRLPHRQRADSVPTRDL
jgi:ketosteroid isomerase-like protein